MGHQTLTDLRDLICSSFDRSGEREYFSQFPPSDPLVRNTNSIRKVHESTSPRSADSERHLERNREFNVQLDHLNLEAGQTFEYFSDSGEDEWYEITVEGIDE